MKSEHTPGPWQVSVVDNMQGRSYVDGVGAKADVADTLGPNHEANAHLIAAAPDMLAALVDVDEWLMDDRYNLPTDVADAIRAAIKKARGEK